MCFGVRALFKLLYIGSKGVQRKSLRSSSTNGYLKIVQIRFSSIIDSDRANTIFLKSNKNTEAKPTFFIIQTVIKKTTYETNFARDVEIPVQHDSESFHH